MQARDHGDPVLSTSVLVNILVEDANDNAPLFPEGNYTVYVQVGLHKTQFQPPDELVDISIFISTQAYIKKMILLPIHIYIIELDRYIYMYFSTNLHKK